MVPLVVAFLRSAFVANAPNPGRWAEPHRGVAGSLREERTVNARRTAFGLALILVFYFVLVGQRGIWLIGRGTPLMVVFGLAVLLMPLVGAWFLWQEFRFGFATTRLARDLEAEGTPPVEDLPRRPSGRVDLAAADAVFVRRKAEVETAPDDWQAWYRLAVAYRDARDTARGRRAMRQAIALHDRFRADADGYPAASPQS